MKRRTTNPGLCSITGKQRYTRSQARRAARTMGERDGAPMGCYWCMSCAAWHIGHARRRP